MDLDIYNWAVFSTNIHRSITEMIFNTESIRFCWVRPNGQVFLGMKKVVEDGFVWEFLLICYWLVKVLYYH